jgi:hypothetical protein
MDRRQRTSFAFGFPTFVGGKDWLFKSVAAILTTKAL